MEIVLEQLDPANYADALTVDREDIPEAWVDTAETVIGVSEYGLEHHLIGHTFLARLDGRVIGIIMIGEAFHWDTDPPEMAREPFYRVLGFAVDRNYRSRGYGGEILENAVDAVYRDFGRRSLALGVHRDNVRAGRFYERHGFRPTGLFEGNDEYYLRLI